MTTWDAAAAAVDYRLRIEAARARINQARIAMTAPPGALPPVDELLRDALDVLEAPRRDAPQKRRRVIPDAAPPSCDCATKPKGRTRPTARGPGAIPSAMFEALRKGRISAA